MQWTNVPGFKDLVEDQFIKFIEAEEVDMVGWYASVREKERHPSPIHSPALDYCSSQKGHAL